MEFVHCFGAHSVVQANNVFFLLFNLNSQSERESEQFAQSLNQRETQKQSVFLIVSPAAFLTFYMHGSHIGDMI